MNTLELLKAGTELLDEAGFDRWGYPVGDEVTDDVEPIDNRDDHHGYDDATVWTVRLLGDVDVAADWLENERVPSTNELMAADLSQRGGERAYIESADGTQVRYTNANQYERQAVAYANNPRSATVVDGAPEWLGAYTDQDGVRHEPVDGRKGKSGRKATCDCGTCTKCQGRARKARYDARIAEAEEAKQLEHATASIADRLASRSW